MYMSARTCTTLNVLYYWVQKYDVRACKTMSHFFMTVSAVKLAPSAFENSAQYAGRYEDALFVELIVDFLAGATNDAITIRVRLESLRSVCFY